MALRPYLPWKALSSALRVEYRRRTRRLWWDDYASIVPAVFECFTIANIWLRLRRHDDSERSQHFKAAYSYMNSAFFCSIIWWSRISLALAVVRITPVWSKTRPLWYIKLQPAQRRLVLLVFSTSVLTLAAAVAVAIASYGKIFKGPGALLVWLMTTNIEESISVVACNLPVLVSWGYRVYSRDDEDSSGDHITPHWSRAAPGGLSTPTFVLTDLSGSRSQISENVLQTSVSETFLPSQIRTQGKDRINEGRKVTEDLHDAISRKDIIV
ncbi:hypothetical protein BDQ12DRAFT_668704 [Crucibulum laeve]|uniref:Uncharacterized protein n=1 Tax=Crucibulum laeve TaxID=68775 RepID=A0A5C3LQW2_9AGAR|nr:hypothetical protein BDQ12DRAFT_668704 [Crucibulum laeve]